MYTCASTHKPPCKHNDPSLHSRGLQGQGRACAAGKQSGGVGGWGGGGAGGEAEALLTAVISQTAYLLDASGGTMRDVQDRKLGRVINKKKGEARENAGCDKTFCCCCTATLGLI